ncbi:MAG TPA: NAD(P)(+) transhydrogenase (Re/Si-specific) subunit beta [bacterium]|nr:NAD(P)(+) transhydrogenase (Re/Si-specific) subunit beta [bacterium]
MEHFRESIENIMYLIGAVLFIFGIKMLGSPKTARKGNFYSAVGMLIAIVVTLFDKHILTYEWIIVGILAGSLIGIIFAVKVEMTSMPQMVGLLNGFGGGASTLVALAEYYRGMATYQTALQSNPSLTLLEHMPYQTTVSIVLGILVGAVTFNGSLVAYAKLQGLISGNSIRYPMQHPLNALMIVVTLVIGALGVMDLNNQWYFLTVTILGLILGITLVIPIGGADMPVVISLLNSYSGIAAAITGFVISNNMLIITGALVGASGIILTDIMCKGMNRSLMNVLLGGWGTAPTVEAAKDKKQVVVKSVDVEEAAMLFDAARLVIVVPGYGMAVAQAQHAVRELMNVLEKKGCAVKFAIHPVAGRMPGHMNVLLAESNVPYEHMYSLEEINDDFRNADIALIIGANDVVNPAARHDQSSPIYGMPILNADYAKTVIINKRSMAAGYAGIDNELFGFPNALMYFGDAKDAVSKLTNELKSMNN